ncbi:hypothetical protein ACFFF7_12665 [Novosphingobium aquiterrae]|uniref:KfrC n=1 Tax=Novosphingobium aquiterrae TaxID=624388 RepID=A0ABV6PKA5_9SPHN
MSDNTDASPVASGTASYTPPTYDIDPADQHIADAILSIDPADLPGISTSNEQANLSLPTSVAALPPMLRAAAEAKLQYIPQHKRAAAEAAAVAEVLRDNTLDIRSKTGFAGHVDEYWQERSRITREHDRAIDEIDRITAQLAEVARYETEVGPDGKSRPRPIFVMGEAARRTAIQRQADLLYKARLLFADNGGLGIEAQRRLDKALKTSVGLRKTQQAKLADMQEVEKRAEVALREKRIQAAVDARVRSRGGSQ